MTSERVDAIHLAQHILNRYSADPDDDLALLSRQFLRSLEASERLHAACECLFPSDQWDDNLACLKPLPLGQVECTLICTRAELETLRAAMQPTGIPS